MSLQKIAPEDAFQVEFLEPIYPDPELVGPVQLPNHGNEDHFNPTTDRGATHTMFRIPEFSQRFTTARSMGYEFQTQTTPDPQGQKYPLSSGMLITQIMIYVEPEKILSWCREVESVSLWEVSATPTRVMMMTGHDLWLQEKHKAELDPVSRPYLNLFETLRVQKSLNLYQGKWELRINTHEPQDKMMGYVSGYFLSTEEQTRFRNANQETFYEVCEANHWDVVLPGEIKEIILPQGNGYRGFRAFAEEISLEEDSPIKLIPAIEKVELCDADNQVLQTYSMFQLLHAEYQQKKIPQIQDPIYLLFYGYHPNSEGRLDGFLTTPRDFKLRFYVREECELHIQLFPIQSIYQQPNHPTPTRIESYHYFPQAVEPVEKVIGELKEMNPIQNLINQQLTLDDL